MKTQKKQIEEQPGWKKRRKDLQSEIRKAMFWKIGGYAAIALVAAFFIWVNVHASLVTQKEKAKVETRHGLGVVEKLQIVQKNGKPEQIVQFKIGKVIVKRAVDAKTYDSMKTGQEYRLTYQVEAGNEYPTKIVDWSPVKYLNGAEKK